LRIDLATRLLFPNRKGMTLEITEERIARQTPEAKAILRALLAKIQEWQDRLKQSPRNCSSPPSDVCAPAARCACGAVGAATIAIKRGRDEEDVSKN
jgi:hypothetical protein